MTRSRHIVLGLPTARLPADAAAEAQRAASHWRGWRRGGAAISAALHGSLALVLLAGWPQLGAQAGKEQEKEPVVVEIVPKPPDLPPEPQKKEPEKKEPEKAAPELPKKQETELPKQQAAVPPEKPQPPAKAPPPPAPPAAAAPPLPPSPGTPVRPQMQWPTPAPPPEMAELPPQLGPMPRLAPWPGGEAPGPDGGLKIEPDVVALPDQQKAKNTDVWVLDPTTVDLKNGCGPARISAVIELNERISEGTHRGTLRTTVRYVRCAPAGTLFHVELRISGNEVTLVGAEGFTDRGVIRNRTMMLEDSYGRSVWRKR